MIEYSTASDMFDVPADARVNTVNCVGVMGKGVALEFATRLPTMLDVYRKLCQGGALRPGHVFVYSAKRYLVFNAATKDHWRQPSKYEWVDSCLVTLAKLIPEHGVNVVTLPALGCGNGGLSWDIVRRRIDKRLDSLKSRVIVFPPAKRNS